VISKLEEAGIPIEVIDLSRDKTALSHCANLGARSTPVIEVPGRDPILGYDPIGLKDLIRDLTLNTEAIHDYVHTEEN
jgi:hypothetical protein